MKYLLTLITLDATTRRQITESWTAKVSASSPYAAEMKTEYAFNIDYPGLTAKVIDVADITTQGQSNGGHDDNS